MKFSTDQIKGRNYYIYPKQDFLADFIRWKPYNFKPDEGRFVFFDNLVCAESISLCADLKSLDKAEIYIKIIEEDGIIEETLKDYLNFINTLSWCNLSYIGQRDKHLAVELNYKDYYTPKHVLAAYTILRYFWAPGYREVYKSILRNINRFKNSGYDNNKILYLSFMDPELKYGNCDLDNLDSFAKEYYYSLYYGVFSKFKTDAQILESLKEPTNSIHESFSNINFTLSFYYTKDWGKRFIGIFHTSDSLVTKFRNETDKTTWMEYWVDNIKNLFEQEKYNEIILFNNSMNKVSYYTKDIVNKIINYKKEEILV